MTDHKTRILDIATRLGNTDECDERYFSTRHGMIPDRKAVIRIVKRFQSIMFPDYFVIEGEETLGCDERLERLFIELKRQITASFAFLGTESVVDTESYAYKVLDILPEVKAALIKDIQAIYEGDPAAKSPEEVILCYPGFYAISIFRIAHEFYKLGIPYMSRIMTEFAHEKTGIDIHAGATVGERFFIDHGTGIVIGETTTIGDNVKIYQGVTLGAKSFELGEDGNPIKGIKRHPDIGNNCVIYANATILGGNTKIGDGSVIGASVWLTSSVEPGTVVYYGKNMTEKK
ncbi:MAG: serine acetyltransferase [Clostridia bacterium]|nr:serine acetyltransferase [Clostridia bacterium]